MATSIITGTSISGSLTGTGSFDKIQVKNSVGQAVNITQNAGDVALYAISPSENIAKFESSDGTAAIVIEDNSSTGNANRVQVVGDVMELIAANSKRVELSSGAIVFNQDSDDVNFRIETNDNDNMVSIDGAKNHMSIGVSRGNHTSDEILVIAGNTGITGSLHVSGNISTSGSIIAKEFRTEFVNQIIATSSGSTTFGDTPADDTHRFTGSLQVSGAFPNLSFPAVHSADKIRLYSGGNEKIGTAAHTLILTATSHSFKDTDGHENFKIGPTGDVELLATGKLYLDGGGHTYISETSADELKIFVGGQEMMKFTEGADDRVTIGSTSHLKIQDGKALIAGDSDDLVIQHSSGHSYIDNHTGDLIIQNDATDKDVILKSDDGSDGMTAYITLDGGNTKVQIDKNMVFSDNVQAQFGGNVDLRIYSDDSNSYIDNENNDLIIQNDATDKDIIFKSDDGSGGMTSYFYLDGSSTKTIFAQSTQHADNAKATFGAAGDFEIYHNGTNSYINNTTGDLHISSSASDKDILISVNDGGTKLEALKIDASAGGTTTFSHDIFLNKELSAIRFGASQQGSIYEHGSDIVISNSAAGNDTIFENLNSDSSEYVKNLFIDGSTSRIGIGTTTPGAKLEVIGDISGSLTSTGSFGALVIDPLHKGFTIGNHSGKARLIYNAGYFQFTDADNSYGSISAESGSFYGDVGIRAAKKLYFDDGEPPVAGGTYISETSDNILEFYTDNNPVFKISNTEGVVVNDGSYSSFDFRVESNAQSHALFVNSGEDAVGMFSPTTGLSGSLVVGKGTNVPGGILMSNGRTFSPGDDISSHFHPVGHYTTGEEVFSIDPTWSDSNLSKYFNKKLTEVAFTQSHDAPGGYAIRIDGAVNVGGVYDSGFPYIPIKDGDVYYQEVWIRNVGGDQTHYMGSNEFDQNGSSTGGNPGSFGYWVMSNTNAGDGEWQKHCGYISGSSISTRGTFETSSMYWTPQALFNYGAGSGTRACLISGWKVIKVSHHGNHIYENMLMSGSIAFGGATSTNVTGGLGLDTSGSAADGTHPWHGRSRIGSPDSIGVSPAQGMGIKTPHGYVLHGPRNSSWNHIITDRNGNYFNAKVTVDSGIVESYDEALQLRRYQSNNNRITIDDGRQQFDMEGRAVLNMNASTTTGHAGISGSLRVSGSDGLSSVMTNRGVDGVPAYSFIGDTDTGILSPGVNNIALATAGTRRYLIDASGNHSIYGNTSFSSPLSVNYGATINEGGNDSDTRIEGSGDANLFRVDAGNDRVGIGTGSPGNKFTVDSTGAYQASIQYDASTRFRISVEDSGRTRFYTDNNADVGVEEGDFYIQPTKLFYLDGGNDTYIHEVTGNEIAFNTGGGERMRLTTGGLGIGLDPAEVLDLKTSSGDCRIRLDAPNGSDTEVKFFNAGAAVFTIGHDDGTGRFVIGTTNVDTAKVTFDTSGNVYATADVTAFSSDKRLKENIRPIENALDKIDKLSGFVYNWNEKANKEVGYDMNKDYVGVFAQDVEKVQPEAVDLAPFDNGKDNKSISGENYLTVKYEKLVPLLIESIKELKQEIKELRENDTSSR